MMNVKETLKRLHKRLPTLNLDELFELLDCYVEEFTLTKLDNQTLWKEPSPWNTTVTYNTVKSDPTKFNLTTNCTDGKIKLYDDGSSTQLIAGH